MSSWYLSDAMLTYWCPLRGETGEGFSGLLYTKAECIDDDGISSPSSHLFHVEMLTGWPESCRAVTNCPMFSWKRPDGSRASTKIFCRLGITTDILSPTTSCRASAIPGANSLDRWRFFTAVNGSKSCNHRVFSMVSFFQTSSR